MGIFDHTSVKTSCNSCSKTASSMGVMDGSMGAMDTMGYSMGAMGAMDGSMGAMGAMGTMDGSIGTMGKYNIKKDKIGKKQNPREAKKASKNAFVKLEDLKKIIEGIKKGEVGSIETAENALRNFLRGSKDAIDGNLGKAIKEFVINGVEVPLEGGGVGIRLALLGAATAGYAVEDIAWAVHEVVSDAIKDARKAV